MARNKMEKEFSERLGQREIQPSASAWDRLDAMLSSAEAQAEVIPVRKSYKWRYIAAVFLGFLFVGTLFFRESEMNRNEPQTKREIVQETTAPSVGKDDIATPEAQIADAPPQVEAPGKVIRKVRNAANLPAQTRQLADNTLNHQPQPDPIVVQKPNPSTQVQPATDDATVEALLATARGKRANNTSGAKVNARQLLLEVDSQAEEKLSPRQRALRALNRNYQQVKVAVENRNIEENH